MGSWGIWNHCRIDCWPGNDFEKWLAWCDDSIMMMTMKMRWCQTTSRKLGGECIFWKAVYGKKHISYWSFKNKMLFTPRHFRRWGGLCAHTRKKKTKQNKMLFMFLPILIGRLIKSSFVALFLRINRIRFTIRIRSRMS